MFLCPDLVNIFHKNTFDPYFIMRSVCQGLQYESFNLWQGIQYESLNLHVCQGLQYESLNLCQGVQYESLNF